MKLFLYKIIHLFYKSLPFGDILNSSFSAVFKLFFFQKLLGFNRKVNWQVHWSSSVLEPRKIKRGKNFRASSKNVYLDGRNGIVFGENVWIGPSVKIISQNHDLLNFTEYQTTNPIKIGSNSWIGGGAIILPDVVLGDHTVVGAGAVVTKSFPLKNQVIAGNPAKKIKKIPNYGSIKKQNNK
tara:strand:- start:14968 stop:15513 length:546 start_codon:yes stop_codon:yes gene_type:complete